MVWWNQHASKERLYICGGFGYITVLCLHLSNKQTNKIWRTMLIFIIPNSQWVTGFVLIYWRVCCGTASLMHCFSAAHFTEQILKGVAHRMRIAAPRRAMSLKFEHIVFYVCMHTGGVIRHLSAAPSNDSEHCSNSCRATERHRHCFILNNIIFVSNRC